MAIAQNGADALIKHVYVKALGAQQDNTALEMLSLAFNGVVARLCLRMAKPRALQGKIAPVTVQQVKGEIDKNAKAQRCYDHSLQFFFNSTPSHNFIES